MRGGHKEKKIIQRSMDASYIGMGSYWYADCGLVGVGKLSLDVRWRRYKTMPLLVYEHREVGLWFPYHRCVRTMHSLQENRIYISMEYIVEEWLYGECYLFSWTRSFGQHWWWTLFCCRDLFARHTRNRQTMTIIYIYRGGRIFDRKLVFIDDERD